MPLYDPTFLPRSIPEADPTICIRIDSTMRLGFKPSKMVDAFQEFMDEHFKPVWGLGAKIEMKRCPAARDWVCDILNRSDESGAEGYHTLTRFGRPWLKVFVADTQEARDLLTVTLTHEIPEARIDPLVNLTAQRGDGAFVGYEVCDAVEATWFEVGGLAVSNFNYPEFFNPAAPRGARLDHLGLCKKPFEILPAGYLPVFKRGRWGQEFGQDKNVAAAKASPRMRKRLAA